MLDNVREITFEITNRCNLRCRICNIWHERPRRDLSPAEIGRFLNNFPSLDSVSLTGGEALLHPDIDSIYLILVKAWLRKKLHNIDIATNATSPLLSRFLARHSAHLGPLTLSVSLDGIGGVHNAQRGTPGAFAKVLKNIALARKHRVPVTIKFVASSLNYRQLPKVQEIATRLGCEFNFKLVEVVPAYYHRDPGVRPPLLRANQRRALAKILTAMTLAPGADPMEIFSRNEHVNALAHGPSKRIRRCLTPERALFVTSDGNVFNCLYLPPVGTLTRGPTGFDAGILARNALLGRRGQCPRCLAYHGYLREFNADIFPQAAAPAQRSRR